MTDFSKKNPFLFLQPYNLKNDFSLKGREDEGKALLALLRWKDLIVVCGRSGIGKTSFINHTLSETINHVSWLPVRVTRLLDINQSFILRIREALSARTVHAIHGGEDEEEMMAPPDDPDDLTEEDDPGDDPVRLMRALYLRWNRPVYLIIDQLEELFLIGSSDEQTTFLATLQRIMKDPEIKKKIILVLRQEHLSYIQRIERILKGVFQEALLVREIRAEAGESIYECLLDAGACDMPEAMEIFAGRLSPRKDRIIGNCTGHEQFDAQKLQIYLYLLWDKIFGGTNSDPEKEVGVFIEELLSAVNPLQYYVDFTVNKVLSKRARLLKASYWWVLINSLSEAGTKKPVAVGDLYDKLLKGITHQQEAYRLNKEDVGEWCKGLADKRIFEELSQAETGGKEDCWYQLRHDTLVLPILGLNPRLTPRFPKIPPAGLRERNPYPGLNQYAQKEETRMHRSRIGGGRHPLSIDAATLYGRESIVKEYCSFLLTSGVKCLVIVGDSGTGKSSLVKGGILPEMQTAGFRTEILQPGEDLGLFREMISRFISTDGPVDGQKACLYIDQFEECYTYREATVEEDEKFTNFLKELVTMVEGQDDHFKLIVSIRHDYAHEFDRRLDTWRKYKKLLRYPNEDEIFDIIVGPAFDRGISFDPVDLPETIASDAMNTSYFLPLLSFTLQTLYMYDVQLKARGLDENIPLSMTAGRYQEIGGIVKCLQQEFTKTYGGIKKGKHLFPELMTRMIVIKDTIPKARQLLSSRINYAEPGKANDAIRMLNEFVPRFFRITRVVVGGEKTESFDPIHDSLLLYCDEIHRIVVKVQQPGSQMYLQPRVEAAVREWRDAIAGMKGQPGQKENESRILSGIITRRYKELEPLFGMLTKVSPGQQNWLFKEELELVEEGKKYADTLLYDERQATENKIRSLELLQHTQRLNEEKIRAEHAEVLSREAKLRAEYELTLSQEKEKRQKLELDSAKADLNAERRRKWMVFLFSFILVSSVAGLIWYINDRKVRNAQQSSILQQKSLLSKINQDKVQLEDYSRKLRLQMDTSIRQNDTLKARDLERVRLIGSLQSNRAQLQKAILRLTDIRQVLMEEVTAKNSSINQYDSLNKRYTAIIADYQAASRKVDSLKNVRSVTLAQLYARSSPALGYRLIDAAMKNNPGDPVTRKVKAALTTGPRYFESLVTNDVGKQSLSGDGQWLVTVSTKPTVLPVSLIRVWDSNGRAYGDSLLLPERVISVDFSFDGNRILVTNENGFGVYDRGLHHLYTKNDLNNMVYARFSETDDRLFAITNKRILTWNVAGNLLEEEKNIPFESGGNVNNAKLQHNYLTVITSKGFYHITVDRKKVSLKSLPQSYILNGGHRVLAMEKPLIGNYRHLTLFDERMQRLWSVKVPDNRYNLITQFVNSADGTMGIVKFNEKDDIVQRTQQQQQQQQVQLKVVRSGSKNVQLSDDNVYYLNLADGSMKPITYSALNNGAYILAAEPETLWEFSGGSIEKVQLHLLYGKYGGGPVETVISYNTRFRQVFLAGGDKEKILSIDANDQLKLWRYGQVDELRNKGQLWEPTAAELEEILQLN